MARWTPSLDASDAVEWQWRSARLVVMKRRIARPCRRFVTNPRPRRDRPVNCGARASRRAKTRPADGTVVRRRQESPPRTPNAHGDHLCQRSLHKLRPGGEDRADMAIAGAELLRPPRNGSARRVRLELLDGA